MTTSRKTCAYCGKQNDEAVLLCQECGTPFTVAPPIASSAPVLVSRSGYEVATGLGVLLIALALFFAVGRVFGGVLPARVPYQRYATYSFFASFKPAPFIAFLGIYPIFALCRARFQKAHALRTAAVIILLVSVLSLLPRIVLATMFLWCLPAVLFEMLSHSSAGSYVGAALQSGLGAFVLIRFRLRSSPNENDTV
jgi:hypothetical protein